MAKITKQGLKEMLKQCLREILQEEGMIVSENISKTNQRKALRNRLNEESDYKSEEDKIRAEKTNNLLNEAVSELSNQISSKNKEDGDIFKEIFQDTAATTLQKQLSAEGGSAANMKLPTTEKEILAETKELESLTDDGDMNKWAKIAFAKNT